MRVFLNQLGIVCSLGEDADTVRQNLLRDDAEGGLSTDLHLAEQPLMLGKVLANLPSLEQLPVVLQGRNNALLLTALEQIREPAARAIARHGRDRVGVVLGTSTSGVGESEAAHLARQGEPGRGWPADYHYAQQEMGTPAAFVAAQLGIGGPAYVISTACSSSAKALAAAARLLRSGQLDAVIAGGADSLCRFTVAGFSALGAVSAQRCLPFSANRCGINIGEGAALFLVSGEDSAVELLGWGESADAHHMSAPDPAGRGPQAAIEAALARAGLRPEQIDYVNLHGTATLQNDQMEAAVVHRIFGAQTPVSSTKPLTGHTLGAAGAIEAALCWLSLSGNPQQRLPPHWWDGAADGALPALALVAPGAAASAPLRRVLTQSFAFGGSNAALILGSAA